MQSTPSYYDRGCAFALQHMGLVKEAKALDWLLRRLEQGWGVRPVSEATKKHRLFRVLFGRPEELLHPISLVKNVASFEPTAAHAHAMLHEPTLWGRTKGLGRLTGDLAAKTFLLGFPAYGAYRGLTRTPLPGETRGEAVGQALGEGLGWLPPLGILGTAAALVAPRYSLPGLTGTLGKHVGRALSPETPVAPESINTQTGRENDLEFPRD